MKRLVLHWLVVSGPLLIVLAAAYLALGSEWDINVYFSRHRDAHPFVREFMKAVSALANPVFYGVYLGLLIRAYKTGDERLKRFVIVYVAVQLIVGFIVVHALKHSLGRPRPEEAGRYMPFTGRYSHLSLPSGHTTELAGQVLPLAMWAKKWGLSLGLGLVLGLLGFARVYLGRHYPTDVFFGWMLGSFAGWTIYCFAAPDRRGQAERH